MHTQQTHTKIALVTGASSGIGKYIAQMLEQEGYFVYASARRTELLQALETNNVRALPMDVTDAKAVQSAVNQIIDEKGRIDLLINNAGYGVYGSIEECDINSVERQFAVNYFGLVRLTQMVLPHMRSAGQGLIVNMASVAGHISCPFMGHYCASKHALEAFSDTLRMEMQPFGVKVVVVEPGVTKSGFEEIALQSLAQSRKVPAYDRMANSYTAATRKMFGQAPEPVVVVDTVRRVIRSSHPKRRYVVGWKNKLLVFTRHWMGYSMIDRAFAKMMGN